MWILYVSREETAFHSQWLTFPFFMGFALYIYIDYLVLGLVVFLI